MGDELAFAGRLLLALLLGGAIGLEREISGHPAGFRTHITVAVGAALFGIVSTDGFDRFVAARADTNVQIDVSRVASQVVVGIGFLGAGTIVRAGGSVRGLTTAASLWVTAAVGLAVGVAAYGPAAVTTAIVLLSLVLLRWPAEWVTRRFATRTRTVTALLRPDADWEGILAAIQAIPAITIRSLATRRREEGVVVEVRLRPRLGADIEDAVSTLAARNDVAEIELT